MKSDNLIPKLVVAVLLGGILGQFANESIMGIVLMVKYILGQIIFFTIPFIIIGFVAASITQLKVGATRLLAIAVGLAYCSTLGAAVFSMVSGYFIIPRFNIAPNLGALREVPELVFKLDIPPIMPVMSALTLSILLGLGVSWARADLFERLLSQFQEMILSIVIKIIMPLLPFFIGATFAELSYEGSLAQYVPIFFGVILVVIVGHFIWLAVLYGVAGLYAKVNPRKVWKHYAPAYVTAMGTMSSAATLPVALQCARNSDTLRKDIVSFGIPLFANIHLCGSVLTEVFFVMTVSQILYGTLPSLSNMIVFVILLGVFGIGAPGVPGGTVMASLGLITGVLGFDAAGTALMLTIFALQDSFGTACNVVGDGALTLFLSGYTEKRIDFQKHSMV